MRLLGAPASVLGAQLMAEVDEEHGVGIDTRVLVRRYPVVPWPRRSRCDQEKRDDWAAADCG